MGGKKEEKGSAGGFDSLCRPLAKLALQSHNKGVNRDRLGERHPDDSDGVDVTEGTGIATHGGGGGHADEADRNSGARASDRKSEIAVEATGGDGHISGFCKNGECVDHICSVVLLFAYHRPHFSTHGPDGKRMKVFSGAHPLRGWSRA